MKRRRYIALADRKSKITYSILNLINKISVANHFDSVTIEGAEKLPNGPFILISNHSARWDGPIVQQLLHRPANYMVSPNELRGLQGLLLRAIGAFPANPKFDLLTFMRAQATKREPIVIFPEGDIHRDGGTHPFKPGAARIALICANDGLDVPVVPIAINYSKTKPEYVNVLIGDPISVTDRMSSYQRDPSGTIHSLSLQLHREVCHLRAELGSSRDRELVFEGKVTRTWAHHVYM